MIKGASEVVDMLAKQAIDRVSFYVDLLPWLYCLLLINIFCYCLKNRKRKNRKKNRSLLLGVKTAGDRSSYVINTWFVNHITYTGISKKLTVALCCD